ncbi:MAG TPA: ABC transporter ATP-binding protein [Acidisarcina sp.]
MRGLLTYLKPYIWQCVVSFFAILLRAGSYVVGPFFVKVAVDRYLTAKPSGQLSSFARLFSDDPTRGITQLAVLYLASLILSFAMDGVQTYLMQWTGQKVMFDLRSQIFRHLQGMHIGYFDRNPVGRIVTRLTSDVDALNEMFTSGVFAIFEDVFVLAFIVAIMLRMSWWLALIAFSVLPLILVITAIFRKYVRDSYRRIRAAIARINAYIQEHVSGMTVVQLFNREDRSYREFEAVNRQHMTAFKDAILSYALYYPAVEILSTTAIALIIWRGGNGVLRNTVSIGVLVAFMQYAMRFFQPIQDLSEKYNILQAAMVASERIFKLLDTAAEVVSPPTPVVPSLTGEDSGSIEFRNVWYTYQHLDQPTLDRIAKAASDAEVQETRTPDGECIEWILRGVSFTIEPNQTAAIVGHTGAGKTTIISLMMRFYDIQRGSILIDGVDVRQQDLTALRQRFGVVLQDPFLFSGTIAENIRLGTQWITDANMSQAAEDVNVADFIRALPLGFDEVLQERGNSLSTGQKQLINFARALAHNPRILVLDEATSSVDTDTELRIRSALERMVVGRTSVVIAHRLSTVQRASAILVMHKGQLREMGTHQELLARHGLYWKLYQLQYKDQELETGISRLAPTLATS